ncbi:3-isopropylmalate dehydratase small subunit [Cereibacter sp. SYSU M97828]|nr:3-isopropylmalate dehydratase small subunit [Cereibacter flavus]
MIEPFIHLTAIAAPFPEGQIDTDVIFPARFLLLLEKRGLGRHLFHERRAKGGFVLDTPPWDGARILVTGPDFGTGSSREQAVWALADFGIRCVIGTSFGEIFHANCFRSCVLPIVLPPDAHARVMAAAEARQQITVDLPEQRIVLVDGEIGFHIEAHRKRSLLEGLDEVGAILRDDAADIAAFEAAQRAARPWLYLTAQQIAHFDDIKEGSE